MTQPTDSPEDPTLAVAERQLAMLAELAEMAMEASRAFKMSAIAASKAETMILGEEWFTPEVGRARACGAKDAADSLQKVTRAVRLTLKLEMTVAEIVRDINAGKITYIGGVAGRKEAGETPAVQLELGSVDRRRPAGPYLAETPDRDRDPRDSESLLEFDRPDRFPRAAFGPVAPAKDAGEDASAPAQGPRYFSRSAGVPAGSSRAETPDRERLDRDPRDSESLLEFDRPDRFPRAAFGPVAPAKDAGEDAGAPADNPRFLSRSAGVPAGPSCAETPDRERLDRDPRDSESLLEFDRPDRFPRAAFSRVAPAKDAGEDAGAPADNPRFLSRSAGVPAGLCSAADAPPPESVPPEPALPP